MRAAAQVESVARQRYSALDAERMRCCVGMCGELCAHLCAVLLATTSSAATSRAHSIAGKAVRAHRVTTSQRDGERCAGAGGHLGQMGPLRRAWETLPQEFCPSCENLR